MKTLKIFGLLSLMIMLLTACKKDESTQNDELILGTWINTLINDQPVLTDDTFVMELKADKTEMYAVGFQLDENNFRWEENNTYTYTINDDVIAINGKDVLGKSYYMEFQIVLLDATTLKYTVPVFKIDGKSFPDNNTYTCSKVTVDLSNQFTGVWYGRSTTPGTADTAFHFWEYFADGNYNYYYQDESGNWIKKSDNEGRYFLYGDFFASNYSNDLISGGTGQAFECWNIYTDGNTMSWTGLRANNLVTSYEMEKVAAPPITQTK
ncbi:MAG: hypothetical protein KJ578_03140 [Bacteroidetes bacterium]|nr:hypothetical protein [Bacteroidota bacterium]MBU1578913.1 hypothetical protein [Bacteroidota bacterium]MBU2556758.1 hypothetical protein [Bacteroidota bacterium]